MSFSCRNGVCSNKKHSHRQCSKRARHAFAAFSAICALSIAVQAQDTAPPGIEANLSVSQRLEYSDNPDLENNGQSDTFGRTVLRFNLGSAKPTERFSLSFGTDIEEGRNDQSTIDINNSNLGIGYTREARNANIQTRFNYRETDVTGDGFDEIIDQDGNIINQDDGTLESYRFNVSGDVGIDAPIGASYGLEYSALRYSDTSDPDLTDRTTFAANGTLNFRLSPRITTQLIGRYSDFDAEGDGVDRETTSLGVGTQFIVNPVLRGNVALTYDRIERSGDEIGTDDGLSLSAGLTQSFKDGTLGLTFSSDVSSNDDGRRTFIGMRRSRDLPRAQSFGYSFGLTRSDGTGVDPIFGLDYSYALSDSRISVSLSQSVNTDSDNEEEIVTSFSGSYEYEVNSLSTLGVTLSFFDRNELGINANDGQRVDLSVTYNYALTRDWGLVSGYRHILSKQDDRSDRDSNTFFVGLQRNFDWRP